MAKKKVKKSTPKAAEKVEIKEVASLESRVIALETRVDNLVDAISHSKKVKGI